MCKKQTSVSHSSTESDVISLGAGLGMDCIIAIDLLDLVIEVLQLTNTKTRIHSNPEVDELSVVYHDLTSAKTFSLRSPTLHI